MMPWVFHSVLSGSLLLAFFSAAEVWKPRIHWSALPNGTVFVTISPKFTGAAWYKICMENSSGCHGKVSEYEIRNDSVVYMVSNLDIYKSYQIWVRPENGDGVALDAWIFKNDLVIFIPPPPDPPTERTSAMPDVPSVPENASGFHVPIAVLTTLLSVLVLCVLLAFVVRKGYLKKVFPCLLWFSCYRRQGLDILLLYINEERSPFTKFVKTHARHLSSFVSCNFVDSTDVRERPNPSSWLLSEMSRCHVLVYMSQPLLDCLQNTSNNSSYRATIVEAVNNLRTSRRLKRGQKAVFVLSGCDGLGTQAARHLTETFGLPCHFVVQNKSGPEHGLTLSSTCDPLHELLGTGTCPCLTCFTCIDSTETTQTLLEAVQELHASSLRTAGSVTIPHDLSGHQVGPEQEQEIFLPEPRGLSTCLQGDCNLGLLPCMDSGFDPDGRGSCSDVSSSPHQVFGNRYMEGANAIEFSQDEGFECLGGGNPETISFIKPEEPVSGIGSQMNIEECFDRINKKSSRHW